MRTNPILILVVVIALLLTACGSDEPGTSSGAPLSVEGLIEAEPAAEIHVTGAVFVNSEGARLCSALMESFPPQCAHPSIELFNLEAVELTLQEEQGVRWTDPPVVLTGTYDEEIFTVTDVG